MISSPDAPARSEAAGRGDRWVVGLAAALRNEGVGIGIGQVVACRRAIAALDPDLDPDPGARTRRFWAARVCLIHDPAHLATFDRVFDRFAEDESGIAASPEPVAPPLEAGTDGGSGSDAELLLVGASASRVERLRQRRFADASGAELAEIGRAIDRLRVGVPRRRSRRLRVGNRGELDLGRTLERSLATDGELVERAWRARRTRPRRLVVLLDVSGSMSVHARLLLRFALAARRAAEGEVGRRVEVFAFATRLTRLSDALAMRDPDTAIALAAERVADWDGGTRIGAALDELVRVWGRRGALRGAVVLICSDGLERGDPATLAMAMRRLAGQAHRIVWLNPLAADADFAPVQRGMAAALPYVDVLHAGDDLADLEALARVIE
jgi:uncharacterized protein